MRDEDKPKEQLLVELKVLRTRLAQLERGESEYKRMVTMPGYAKWLEEIVEQCSHEFQMAQEKLTRSEARLRSFLEAATDSFLIFDSKLNIVEANPTALKKAKDWMGLDKKDVIGKNLSDFAPDLKKTGRYAKYLTAVKTGVPYFIDDLVIHQFGGKHVAVKAFKVSEGLGIIVTDMTKQKKAEKALKTSEERHRSLVELAPDGIITLDLKGVITFCNPAAVRLSGLQKDELVGKHFTKVGVLRKRDIPQYLKLFGSFVKGTKVAPFEFVWCRKDGAARWGEAHIRLLKVRGKMVGIQAILRDITPRKQVEAALQTSEERFRSVVQTANDAIITIDSQQNIMLWNHAAETIFGYSVEEIVSRPLRLIIPERFHGAYQKGMNRMVATRDLHMSRKSYEVMGRRKDDSEFPAELSIATWKTTEGVFFTSIVRDITERKRVEEALRESEQQYQLLAENVSDVIWIMDMNWRITYISPSTTRLRGYSVEEAMAQTLTDVLTPTSLEVVMKTLTEEATVEGMEYKDLARSRTLELELICKNGSTVWTEIKMTALRNSEGTPVGILGVTRDITERKNMETALRKTHDERGL